MYFEKEYGWTISETQLKKDHGEFLPEGRLCRHLINDLAERNVSIQSFIDVLNNPHIGMNAIADEVKSIATLSLATPTASTTNNSNQSHASTTATTTPNGQCYSVLCKR